MGVKLGILTTNVLLRFSFATDYLRSFLYMYFCSIIRGLYSNTSPSLHCLYLLYFAPVLASNWFYCCCHDAKEINVIIVIIIIIIIIIITAGIAQSV
jgi:hypothetical protein